MVVCPLTLERTSPEVHSRLCGVRMKPVGAIGSMVLSIALLVNSMGGVGTLSNIEYYMNSLILL